MEDQVVHQDHQDHQDLIIHTAQGAGTDTSQYCLITARPENFWQDTIDTYTTEEAVPDIFSVMDR